MEDEVRLREFRHKKAIEQAQRSESWKIKTEIIKQKQFQAEEAMQEKAAESVQAYEQKLQTIEMKMAEEEEKRQCAAEERNLKLVDAAERKGRVERLEDHKREQMAEAIQEQHARVHGLMTLKSQILDHRRQRAQIKGAATAEAMAKAKSIKHLTPGPAAYEPQPSSVLADATGVAKIPDPERSRGRAAPPVTAGEGSIAAEVARTRELPPVGAYNPTMLRDGSAALGEDIYRAIKIGERHGSGAAAFIEQATKAKKSNPGPGAYNVVETATDFRTAETKTRKIAGAKIGASVMGGITGYAGSATAAAGFAGGRPNRAWLGDVPQDGPGPAAYAVDSFTRKQRVSGDATKRGINLKAAGLG